MGIAVADINGDGRPDLIVANEGSGTVSLLLGNGNGTFQSALNFNVEIDGVGTDPVAVAVGPFDEGGNPGVAVVDCNDPTPNSSPTYVPTSTAGSITILLNQTATATATVAIGPVSQFVVTAPSSPYVGNPFTVTVSATDAGGNVITNYSGTVHFSSNDYLATLPADYAFDPYTDHGVHTFSATLNTVGSESIIATDTVTGSITGYAVCTVQNTGPAASFAITATVYLLPIGDVVFISVSALDSNNNIATSYTGTVVFSDNNVDSNAIAVISLPTYAALSAAYSMGSPGYSSGNGFFRAYLYTSPSFTLTDGTGEFAVLITTSCAITAVDSVTPSITGSSSTITGS